MFFFNIIPITWRYKLGDLVDVQLISVEQFITAYPEEIVGSFFELLFLFSVQVLVILLPLKI